MDVIKLQTLTESECAKWQENQSQTVVNWLHSGAFTGAKGQVLMMPGENGTLERVLCGAGRSRHTWTLGALSASLGAGRYQLDEDWDEPTTRQMALGFRLGQYQFDRYRTMLDRQVELEIPAPWREEIDQLVAATALVRNLVNTPAEHMGPEALTETAGKLAEEHATASLNEVVGEQLLAQNFPAIHVVGRAAEQAPRLIELTWSPAQNDGNSSADLPLVALVGKGVCFDSGGLNMKGASGMLLMKKDMGGSAHVLALAQLIMQCALPVRLLVLISAVENAVSGNAYRPGDVIATRKGTSVEIGNTDAEGRLVMSDALTYACEMSADLVVDFATLTGAARVALGPDVPPFFTNHEGIAGDLMLASEAVEDPLWRLPLHQPYRDMLHSSIADFNNVGGSGFAGCITAALFLEHFVTANTPWVHIDTYAWNQGDRPGRPKGGEALGLRAVFEWLKGRYAE
ncbi:MAG: M17 family metallopeptidase [Lysobacterales bacterium]